MQFTWSSLTSSTKGSVSNTKNSLTAFLAFKGFEKELEQELLFLQKKILHQQQRLFLIEDFAQTHPVWAQLVLHSPQILPIESISDGAKKLKAMHPLWAHWSHEHFRRAELIQEQLPRVVQKTLPFLGEIASRQIGFWSLVDKNILLACPQTKNPFPCGDFRFDEDKVTPPSRAYLKLWELFTVHGVKPKLDSRVIDFGSSPGGWTWVLQKVGCAVKSIDRSPLAPQIQNLNGVEFIQHNAFSLKPQDLGPVDWFFSDIICYPEKLYELIQSWISSGLCKNFVCTIKYQGETDFKTTELFQKIPGSKVVHLLHNKHEVTWILRS